MARVLEFLYWEPEMSMILLAKVDSKEEQIGRNLDVFVKASSWGMD